MELPEGIERLASGSYRARVKWKGRTTRATFPALKDAVAWRSRTKRQLSLGTHESQQDIDPETNEALPPYFSEYAETWLAGRGLKPLTVKKYRALLDQDLLPVFGRTRVDQITVKAVKSWYVSYAIATPTRRAHGYGLLRAILMTAFQDDLIPANPCRVRGAGTSRRASTTTVPTAAQVAALVDALPSPKYRVMTLVSAWCGLRFGETTELRRKDLVLVEGVPVTIRVRRGVVRVNGQHVVDSPKSYAGVRDVAVPPHIRQPLADYLATVPPSPEALLFPGSRSNGHMMASSLFKVWRPAREEAGLPDLRWHDLRHFAGTMTAVGGGTLREIQGRLGHSTVAAAMRYQGIAQNRDAALAERLSEIAGA